jgi:membrane-associated phospholipid phosphatase
MMSIYRHEFFFGIALALLCVLIMTGDDVAANSVKEEDYSPSPFSNIGENSLNSFIGWNSLYHLTAIGLTAFIVYDNLDVKTLRTAQKWDKNESNAFGVPGMAIGTIAPIALPISMYLASGDGDLELRYGSFAVMQSVGVAFLCDTALKAVTGRRPPDSDHRGREEDLSREFRFGFLRGGVFNGWPSGHSMVNMALASSISAYYPEKTWVRALSYGMALYIMSCTVFGMNGNVHWLSDTAAGGLMGYAIGATIGKRFYQFRRSPSLTTGEGGINDVMICPIVSHDGGAGFMVVAWFE